MRMPALEVICQIANSAHEQALEPQHIAGIRPGMSLEAALSRPYNRLVYGLAGDVFDVAAQFCEAIARGHIFNDGNKRTSFILMAFILEINDIEIRFPLGITEDVIVEVASGKLSATQLAQWLRNLCEKNADQAI